MSSKYEDEANKLAKVVDISIEAFEKYPRKNLTPDLRKHIKDTYLKFKQNILYPEPKFKNIKSLKYDVSAIFHYFQEASGSDVEYFWQEIIRHDLPYKRENKLLKILKRKRIKDDIEYDFVIDVLVPYIQQGIINNAEEILLKKLIGEFENKASNKK